MRIPVLKGTIKRRLLVNFRVDAEVMRRQLPEPFRPKLHQGFAIAGICLIRLEEIRPKGFPGFVGITSENAAHRIAVEWTDANGALREGVYIPRRDTSSRLNHWAGGTLFPGEHHLARFSVSDDGQSIDLAMQAKDGAASLRVSGHASDALPGTSCFESLLAASAFFEGGSVGYSVTQDETRLDGIALHTLEWKVNPLTVSLVESSYFEDTQRFPSGSVIFDHALIMRDLLHEWHQEEDMVIERWTTQPIR